jgi:hypothetical protein
LSPLLRQEEVDYFIWAWQWLADNITEVLAHYRFNPRTKGFELAESQSPITVPIALPSGTRAHAGNRIFTFPQAGPNLLQDRQDAVETYIKKAKLAERSAQNTIAAAWDQWREFDAN